MDLVLLCSALFLGPVAFCAFLLGCHKVGQAVAARLEARQWKA